MLVEPNPLPWTQGETEVGEESHMAGPQARTGTQEEGRPLPAPGVGEGQEALFTSLETTPLPCTWGSLCLDRSSPSPWETPWPLRPLAGRQMAKSNVEGGRANRERGRGLSHLSPLPYPYSSPRRQKPKAFRGLPHPCLGSLTSEAGRWPRGAAPQAWGLRA